MISKEPRSGEERAVCMTRFDVAAMAGHEIQRLVSDLQCHQIELEAQNEALRCTQRQLELSRKQNEDLFDCAPVAYLVLDPTGVVLRANAVALRLLCVSRENWVGQRWTEAVLPEDQSALQEHLHNLDSNTQAPCELCLTAENGSVVNVVLHASRLPTGTGECLVVLTDISERKRTQQALEDMNRELEARSRRIAAESAARTRSEAKRRELEIRLRDAERLESLGMLAAGIAHDFNNLLVSVLGNAELLLATEGLVGDMREPLSLIKRASHSATDLTRELLVFAGRRVPNKVPVRLPKIVAGCLELLRVKVPAGTQLQAQISDDIPAIDADPGQLHQVVMNLVTNAMEALGGDGVVLIRIYQAQLDANALSKFQHRHGVAPGRFAILHVHDSGSGIDPASLARIFDPFFTTKFTGRGLGLASVLGIVQGHRAALHVHSTKTEGTTFEVALSVSNRQEAALRACTAGEPVWSGAVLLIDDDHDVRQVVARLLTHLGFTVTSANGGAAGLEQFRRAGAHFDLVVLDWIMPGVSGQQVLQSLRQTASQLPVVLISGYNTADLAIRDDHVARVQKPMTFETLQDAIDSVLGERCVETQNALFFPRWPKRVHDR